MMRSDDPEKWDELIKQVYTDFTPKQIEVYKQIVWAAEAIDSNISPHSQIVLSMHPESKNADYYEMSPEEQEKLNSRCLQSYDREIDTILNGFVDREILIERGESPKKQELDDGNGHMVTYTEKYYELPDPVLYKKPISEKYRTKYYSSRPKTVRDSGGGQ
jgi:hypothetical protein